MVREHHNPGARAATGLSRRGFLAAQAAVGTAAALAGVSWPAGRASAADGAASAAGKMKIGMATLGFSAHSNASLAKELAGTGIKLVQLFLAQTDSKYWKYNGRSDVSSLTPDRCRAIAAAYRDAGIEVHSLGVYTNLIHPDPAERKANLDYFNAMMEIGGNMGVRTFITEAGHHYDAAVPAPRIPLEFQDEVWPRMVATGQELGEMAAKHDAKVLFEAFYRGFFASAKRTRMFLAEVNSPRIRALLDPANLIEVNDVDEMFHQLGPYIDCIHAKDRKLHTDRGVAAGKGDLDYHQLVTCAAKYTPHAPLVLEYVGQADYAAALAHLRSALREAGIGEV